MGRPEEVDIALKFLELDMMDEYLANVIKKYISSLEDRISFIELHLEDDGK